jgi:hypothetical protein
VLTTLALLVRLVAARDSFGHMVVASVAYQNLDAKTRKRVDALLALNPYFKDKWPELIPAGTSMTIDRD